MFDSSREISYSMMNDNEVRFQRHYFEDDDDDDYFMGMGIRIFLYVVASLIFLGIMLCLWRCQRRRRRQGGQILSPPSQPGLNTSAPYPQQVYAQPIYYAPPPVPPAPNNPAYPNPAGYPGYPNAAAPYPTTTAYPVASQYQTAAAPYPAAGAPYSAAGAPYPAAGAPYPTGAPGPAQFPYPQPTAPSAPDEHALPPSYDQAVTMNKTH